MEHPRLAIGVLFYFNVLVKFVLIKSKKLPGSGTQLVWQFPRTGTVKVWQGESLLSKRARLRGLALKKDSEVPMHIHHLVVNFLAYGHSPKALVWIIIQTRSIHLCGIPSCTGEELQEDPFLKCLGNIGGNMYAREKRRQRNSLTGNARQNGNLGHLVEGL